MIQLLWAPLLKNYQRRDVRIKSDSTNKFSVMCICLLPSEISLQLKIIPRNIYKNKWREDEIDTIFNRPCLFTSNALIQFKSPMLVYEEYINAGVSIYISHITIFTFSTCTPHLISIIKCHHRHPQLQCPLTATLRFQQQFVLDETPLPKDLIRFSSHPCLLV